MNPEIATSETIEVTASEKKHEIKIDNRIR